MKEGGRVLLEFQFPAGSEWEGGGCLRMRADGRITLERLCDSREGNYWLEHPSENAAEAAELVFREMLRKVRDRNPEIFEMANEEFVVSAR